MATMTRASAVMMAPRPTVPTLSLGRRAAPLQAARPAALQSKFLGRKAGFSGFCSSFRAVALAPLRQLSQQRQGFTIQANAKNCIGNTLGGTKRKAVRVSGFKARMSSPGGRKVLKRRRLRGRKRLVTQAAHKK